MIANNSINWYETTLPPCERKTRGHFSTPGSLVERILDACGYKPEHNLLHTRVLDPACGSGNFLVGAARRLITSGMLAELPHAEILSAVQRNLWGFDPDPVACFLAQMHLGDTLSTIPSSNRYRGKHRQYLHIHQADGVALPWSQQGAFDLFLANPPYLAVKNTDLSGYQWTQGRGQVDIYLLFLALALHAVRPNGWIGLVLPDPVLARVNASRERKRLLAETTIHQLWHLAGAFPAQVGAVVIVAQRCPPKKLHRVNWIRGKWQVGTDVARPDVSRPMLGTQNGLPDAIHRSLPVKVGTVAQRLMYDQPHAELRYLLGDECELLVRQIYSHPCSPPASGRSFAPLSQFVSIRRGEELGKKANLLVNAPPQSSAGPADQYDWYPVLRGGVDVKAYTAPAGHCWLARATICKPLERYLAPKLLVVKSTPHLQAALDLRGHIALQTLYLLNAHSVTTSSPISELSEEDQLYFLLALLNSRLLREYVYVLHTAYKWVQPQLEQHVLACLPIPDVPIERNVVETVIQRARMLVLACTSVSSVVELKEEISTMYEQQELAIRALYQSALSMNSFDVQVF